MKVRWRSVSSMYYLDANVFISAVIDAQTLGDNSGLILDKIARKELSCTTSLLTLDEVCYVIGQNKDRRTAIRFCENFLELPINFVNVDRQIMASSFDLMKEFPLLPRDSIHAATAKSRYLTKIISEDADFDKLPEFQRLTIAQAARL